MALKDWKKEKDTGSYLRFRTKAEKDHNIGEPKHLQVKDSIYSINVITIMKQWKMEDVEQRLEKNAIWVVRYWFKLYGSFKTKSQALKFAKKYMRSH